VSAQQREFRVSPDEAGSRLDAFVAARAGVSRAAAARMIEGGSVLVDGGSASKSRRIEGGMRIDVSLPAVEEARPQPEDIKVPVVFEDDYLLVVSKPAGLVVHPAPGHASGTLVNALLARAGAKPAGGDIGRPGIVHRLDAGTSGLMIVAKDEATHAALTEALAARAITRIYLALVEGIPDTDTATIDAPIGRSPRDRKKMAVVAGGRPAVTEIKVLERYPETALVEARPITGRTHQIRVHLKAAKHPVVGDGVYGKNRRLAASLGLERPFLHAARLSFEHPSTGARVELEDPLPADLEHARQAARARS
jgi:23S rRNA pseudouridine1911/1915/1917 synthase